MPRDSEDIGKGTLIPVQVVARLHSDNEPGAGASVNVLSLFLVAFGALLCWLAPSSTRWYDQPKLVEVGSGRLNQPD